MIKEVKMLTIVCNICGRDANEGDDYAAWTEIDPTYDNAENSGWYMEKHDENIHYCMNCHSFDDDDNLILKVAEPAQIAQKEQSIIANVMPSCLRLSLKAKWFEMTNPTGKTEDYRELTPYWYSIFCLYDGQKKSKKFWEFAPLYYFDFDTSKVSFKKYDVNVMTLGYPSNSEVDKIKKFVHVGIEIKTGRVEWGAIKGKLYFVIMHGAIIA